MGTVKKICFAVAAVAIAAAVAVGGATADEVGTYVTIALSIGAAIAAVVAIFKKA
jgi:hypothetical protein